MTILESIFILLSAAMRNTKYFGEVFPMVTEKYDGINSFPVAYKNRTEIDKLLLEDKYRGITYFRKNGNIRSSVNTDERYSITSCEDDTYYNISIPIRQIIFLPKDKLSCDNAFSEDDLALQIVSILTDANISDYIQNVDELSFTFTGYETESSKVIKQEYSNYKEIVDINYNWIYISIDWDLFMVADSKCLNSCENPVGLPGVPIITTSGNYVISHIPHTQVKYGALIQVAADIFKVPEGAYKSGSLVLSYNGQGTAFFTELSGETTGEFQTGWIPTLNGQNQLQAQYIPL